MGLDMFAYVAAQAGESDRYWSEYDLPEDQKTVEKPREIAYWRKHPNLHGWMEQLWVRKVNEADGVIVEDSRGFSAFNGVELELTWEDLDDLETAVTEGQLPGTTGFFFGDNSDDLYKPQDLEFIKQARAELFSGLRVFYNSSW